jgi:hypothetical protein
VNSVGDGCKDCEAGMYSDSSTDFICEGCPEGSCSPRGASECEVGKYQNQAGQALCAECPL